MKENEKLLLVKELLSVENAEKAKDLFQKIEPENTVMYFMIKGLIEQKFQQWGAAINTFQKVLKS